MMNTLIERFIPSIAEALEIGRNTNLKQPENAINKCFVAGLGGSGIGANFVSDFIKNECKIPFVVGKSYHIPAWVDKNTLCIVSSFSGNTEETISSYNEMLDTGAKIVVISSGGKLRALAEKNNQDYIQLPSNWSSPRATLAYAMIQQLFILKNFNIISDRAIHSVEKSMALLESEQDNIKTIAEDLAHQMHGKIPIIYSEDRIEAVTVRWRQQINENSKFLCWHHVIPEMNHNELVGWKDKDDRVIVTFLRSQYENPRNGTRMDIMKDIISEMSSPILEVFGQGEDEIQEMLYFVNLGDWLSWYLSVLHDVDSIEVDVIDHLKSELSKI